MCENLCTILNQVERTHSHIVIVFLAQREDTIRKSQRKIKQSTKSHPVIQFFRRKVKVNPNTTSNLIGIDRIWNLYSILCACVRVLRAEIRLNDSRGHHSAYSMSAISIHSLKQSTKTVVCFIQGFHAYSKKYRIYGQILETSRSVIFVKCQKSALSLCNLFFFFGSWNYFNGI